MPELKFQNLTVTVEKLREEATQISDFISFANSWLVDTEPDDLDLVYSLKRKVSDLTNMLEITNSDLQKTKEELKSKEQQLVLLNSVKKIDIKDDKNIKNLSITDSELRQDISCLVKEVEDSHIKTKKVESELNVFLCETNKQKENREIELFRLEDGKKRIELQHSLLKQQIFDYQKIIPQFKEEKKILQKELNKLNSWVLAAKEEKEKLDLKNKEFDLKLSEKRKKVEIVLSLENEIKGLEKKRDMIRLESDMLLSGGKEQLAILIKKIDETKKKVEDLQIEAEHAQNKKHRIDDEAGIRVQDLIEYTRRIKEVWDKVFPGQQMPTLPFK